MAVAHVTIAEVYMPSFDQGGASAGSSLAAGTILVALIDALVSKGILSKTDVRELLEEADTDLKPKSTIESAIDARKIVAALVARFNR